jgi:hypothetical protein
MISGGIVRGLDRAKTTGDGPAKPPSPIQIRAAPPTFKRSRRDHEHAASIGSFEGSRKSASAPDTIERLGFRER